MFKPNLQDASLCPCFLMNFPYSALEKGAQCIGCANKMGEGDAFLGILQTGLFSLSSIYKVAHMFLQQPCQDIDIFYCR